MDTRAKGTRFQWNRGGALVMLVCWMVWAAPAAAAGRGRGLEFGVGYGFSFNTERDIRFVSFLPRYRHRLVTWGPATGTPLDLDLLVEGMFNVYLDPETAEGVGVIPMLRLDWKIPYVHPYVGGGIGPYWFNLDVQELGQEFNFLSQAEIGFGFPSGSAVSWHLSYRIQHISNAGMSERNSGINSHMFSLGLSWTF